MPSDKNMVFGVGSVFCDFVSWPYNSFVSLGVVIPSTELIGRL